MIYPLNGQKNLKIILTVALFSLFLSAKEVSSQIKPELIESKIKLDGLLDEFAWGKVEPVSDFTQSELIEGAAPTEKTEVRFLYDEYNLYIGIVCYDSEPDKIVHKELKRDGVLYRTEDNFTMVLDTYHDKRNGYYFAVNANGSQYAGTFQTHEPPNTEWDGIWDVSSRITDFGWTSEIVIPFKTLRFPNTNEQIWGINFRRQIQRKNEELMWRAWRRDDDLLHLSKGGTLHIARPLKQSRQLDLKPYLIGGVEKEQDQNLNDTFKYGLDLRYGVTSNTTLVLTANTDFAQIESDRETINLTRYDISYPEKRDFFLEGSEIFKYSQGMTNLFYSRRIGISPERESIPVLGGAKLTQKTGSYTMGLLTMQTDEKNNYPSANYSVMRIKKDIFEQSYIGFIATSILDTDGHDNQVYGTDVIFKTDTFFGDKNFEIQSYLTGSVTDGSFDDSMAGRIYFNFPNDLVNAYILYHALGPNFNPEMGFIRGKKPGVHQYMARFEYTPRPSSLPFIKKLDFEPFMFNYYTDMSRKLIARTTEFRPFGFITNSDDEFGFNIKNEYDYVEEAFTMFEDVIIPIGGYEWWFYEMDFDSSRSRPIALELKTRWGDFYNGTRNNFDVECTFKSNMHYALSADVKYNNITIGNRK
ncbi:MAG: carbohydrate binding family 9 domain-containing protein, partial [Candidatus Latescibacteria bacterium]|nr:carbohydrate binding family 9 domain-containing protein [Candidatus Latescibacterota bacterium]